MRRRSNIFKVIKSSWRHPGAILCFFWVLFTHDHIFITERHFSCIFLMIKVNIRPVNFRSENARACVRPRVSARAKNKNAQNRLNFFFAYVSCPFKHFAKKLAHAHARAFSRVMAFRNIKSPIFLCHHIFHIFPSNLIPCSPFSAH